MLVLSRKQGENVIIADNIRLTVVAVQGNKVRLGITAPPTVSIVREELRHRAEDVGPKAVEPSPPRMRRIRSVSKEHGK
jgi:carbon storage regulator